MAERGRLSHAPVQEAVIDIRFDPPLPSDLVTTLAQDFSSKHEGAIQDLWETEFQIQGPDEGGATSTRQVARPVGKRIDLQSSHHVVQLRTTGFMCARLAPYDSWETMSEVASAIWQPYLASGRAKTIRRLAVRYVNALSLPMPVDDFEDFLVCAPNVPASLPQTVSTFMSRIQIVEPETLDFATVTQVSEGVSPDGKNLRVVFDIDAYNATPFDATDSERIHQTLNRLRDFKNNVFFSYLTDATLEQYR
jgi:uncharacterized protein (TIGR04255 family)